MYILLTYDISTRSKSGEKRLRMMAKACENIGQRVQNSVFEIKADHAEWILFRSRLLEIANLDEDSLRFYYLGKNWEHKVEHHGTKPGYNVDGPLIV